MPTFILDDFTGDGFAREVNVPFDLLDPAQIISLAEDGDDDARRWIEHSLGSAVRPPDAPLR